MADHEPLARSCASTMWTKSSYSGPQGNECVEVALADGAIAIRDSKDPHGPVLTFLPEAYLAFVRDVADGRFGRTGSVQ